MSFSAWTLERVNRPGFWVGLRLGVDVRSWPEADGPEIRARYRGYRRAATDPKRTSRWNIAHHFVPRITQAAKPDRMTS